MSSDSCRAARSALVCDEVNEAKRLAYMGPERHKVVAQDGTLIAKSGCITGGLTGSEAERAQRFDEQRTVALKEVRQRLTNDPILHSAYAPTSSSPQPAHQDAITLFKALRDGYRHGIMASQYSAHNDASMSPAVEPNSYLVLLCKTLSLIVPQKRAQYAKELADLPAERAAAQNEQRLSSQIAGLAKQLEYKAVDLKATEEKLGKLAAELQTLAQARRLPYHLGPARQNQPCTHACMWSRRHAKSANLLHPPLLCDTDELRPSH